MAKERNQRGIMGAIGRTVDRANTALAKRYSQAAVRASGEAVRAGRASVSNTNYGARVPGRAGGMIRGTGMLQADTSREAADRAGRAAGRARAAASRVRGR